MAPHKDSRAEQASRQGNLGSTTVSGSAAHDTPPATTDVVTAGSTSTQQAIRRVLQVDSPQIPAEALMALMELESRPVPSGVLANELDRKLPHTCCFDSASSLCASWTSHKLCERCSRLNELLQACSKSTQGESLRGAVGLALLVTDCISVKQSEEPSHLPAELTSMCLGSVIAQACETKDGATLGALCHTSSWLRYKLSTLSEPSVLYQTASGNPDSGTEELLMPFELISYVWQSVTHLFEDISVQRHGSSVPALPTSKEMIMRTDGSALNLFESQATIFDLTPSSPDEADEVVASSERDTPVGATCGSLYGVCEQLSSLFNELHHEYWPLGPDNLYVRARNGDLKSVDGSASCEVDLWFYDTGSMTKPFASITWNFLKRSKR